jgi:hypothetical protein
MICTETAEDEQLAQLDQAVAMLSAMAEPPLATDTVWRVVAVPEQPAQLLVAVAVATALSLDGPIVVSARAESVTRGSATVGMAEDATSREAEALTSSDGPRPWADAGPTAEPPASDTASRARARAEAFQDRRRAMVQSSFVS